MSKDNNKYKVFRTTRVRTALKNDGCWIHKSEQENDEQDKARTDHAVETRPAPVRQNSYVLSTARKFESLDSPLSPPLQKTQFFPSKGDSANQANGEVIPLQKDAQPQGSIVETTDDAKPEAPADELIQNGDAQPEKSVAPAENKEEYVPVYRPHVVHDDGAAEVSAEVRVEEHIQNGEAQPEKSVATTSAENKEEYVPVYRPHVVHDDGAAEVSAEVRVEEHIQNGEAQPVPSANENPDPLSLLWGHLIAPVANTTEENKGEHADTTVDQSSSEHKVSADAHVEDPVAETSAAAGSDESKDTADVPTVPAVELKPQGESSTETEPANATHLEDAGVESTVQPAEGSCEKCPPEQAAEEAVAEVVAKSSPDASDVVNATPEEETALQVSVEPVPDLVAEAVSELPTQPAAETATKGSCEEDPPEQTAGETVEVVGEIVAKSSPDTSDVVNATPGEEAALQDCIEVVAEIAGESLPDTSDLVNATPEEETALQVSVEPVPDLVADAVSELPTQPAAETATKGSCEEGPAELSAGETIEAAHEVAVESSPETPAVTGAAGEETAAVQVSVEAVSDLVTDTVSELPAQPAAETAVQSVECEVEPAASTEPVLEVVECEVQPGDNTVVEQSAAADHAVELNIEDALDPVTVSDAVQDKFSDRPIELSEALDVEPPTAEASPEPLQDPKPSHTEETKPNQHSDDTNTSDMSQESKEEQQSTQTQTRDFKVCSFCDKIIEGNTKIHLSDPAITCHPDCLKCGVCAMALGDLLTAMFLHKQVVQCGGCFEKALEI